MSAHSQTALLAEFETPEALASGIRELTALGLRDLDAYTPYPLKEIEPLLRIRRSPIPRWVLGGGIVGCVFAYLVEWWCATIAYPLDIGGRPFHSAPAFIPIAFETTILFAALTAFVSVAVYAKLLRLHDPVFEVPGFARATVDRFWLAAFGDVDSAGALPWSEPDVRARLTASGALQVVVYPGAR